MGTTQPPWLDSHVPGPAQETFTGSPIYVPPSPDASLQQCSSLAKGRVLVPRSAKLEPSFLVLPLTAHKSGQFNPKRAVLQHRKADMSPSTPAAVCPAAPQSWQAFRKPLVPWSGNPGDRCRDQKLPIPPTAHISFYLFHLVYKWQRSTCHMPDSRRRSTVNKGILSQGTF